MSYQVLARKWRPQTFDDVFGQSHVTTPLRNAIRSDRVPHAVLLTGPRGTGKTTLARILARCLNCEKGPTDTPCGECTACAEITAGTSTDVREIDAASRTGVDDVRELIEAIRYAPSPGKYRIFVVDEVHMLSPAAFNALLKTLEEPPPRSLFVFATTNPEKIPFTVISRCQRHDLRRINARLIVENLALIIQSEGVEISEQSLLAIAREADGSLRDAQTLLDQVIAFGGSPIDDERVADILDLVDRRLLVAIARACVRGDAPEALTACARAGEGGVDAKRLGENLLQLFRDLLVLRIAPDAEGLVEGGDEELTEMRELAAECDDARLRRMFRALLREQEDLAWAPQPFAVLEMAVVRLATLPAGDDVAQLLSRLDALERQLRGGGGSPSGGGGSAPRRGGERAKPPSGGGSRTAPSQPTAETQTAPRAESPAAPRAGSRTAKTAPEPPPLDDGSLEAMPAVVFDRLKGLAGKEQPGLFAALEGGRILERDADSLRLFIPEAFAARRLRDRLELLEALCERFFGRPTRVEIDTEEVREDATTPEVQQNESLKQLRQRALGHPAVNRAMELLKAEIVEIRPPTTTPPGTGPS